MTKKTPKSASKWFSASNENRTRKKICVTVSDETRRLLTEMANLYDASLGEVLDVAIRELDVDSMSPTTFQAYLLKTQAAEKKSA